MRLKTCRDCIFFFGVCFHKSLTLLFLSLSLPDSHVDVLSLSSGVGTSSQSGSAGSATTPTESQRSLILPGMHVVCLENHSSGEPGSLHISQGDIIEGRQTSNYIERNILTQYLYEHFLRI